MSDSDLQLLERYARQHSEDAFAEIVRRHLDLVFSAALRQVRSPQLAEEVAQSVFSDLARQAHRLAPNTVLSAWLYQVTRRTAIDLVRREARRQAREQAACEINAMNTTLANWTDIEPLLDEAMQDLDDAERAAVLLRYFENKSLREMGQALGITEDAARKRVSRAVDRLRDFLARRGATIGASGLVALISANAVQAAPAGLAVIISTAGTLVNPTAAATTAKAVIMTTLQKTAVATVLVAAVATAVYQTGQASRLRAQVQTLQKQQAPLTEQIEQRTRQRDEASRRLAALSDENDRLTRNTGELLRLRAEVARLRQERAESAASKPAKTVFDASDPSWQPNWIVLRPFDLAQFPDSSTRVVGSQAADVGTATPAALLQTWIWAQRTGNTAGLLKTWDFPEGTTEEQKLARVKEAQTDEELARQNPNQPVHFEESRLRDLFSLGDDYYLAFIEEKGPTTGAWVGHQLFRRVGDEWRVSLGRVGK